MFELQRFISMLFITLAFLLCNTVFASSHSTLNEVEAASKNFNNYYKDDINMDILLRSLNFATSVYCDNNETMPKYGCNFCDQQPDFTVSRYFSGTMDIIGYLGYSIKEKSIWLVFRGTERTSIANWITNFDYSLRPLDPKTPNNQIHEGFHHAYHGSRIVNSTVLFKDMISEEVVRLHKAFPFFKFKVTGHSLGGSLAVLSIIDLHKHLNIYPDTFISFGLPRIGNKVFADWFTTTFKKTYIRRVTHKGDPIVHLPPRSFGFEHFGFEIFQPHDDTNQMKFCYTDNEWRCSAGVFFPHSIKDHLTYLSRVTGKKACQDTHNGWVDPIPIVFLQQLDSDATIELALKPHLIHLSNYQRFKALDGLKIDNNFH